jgi:hypothetical protein
MLLQVPEVSLQPATAAEGKTTTAARKAALRELETVVKNDGEGFLRRFVARRPDLATLPFQDEERCRLDQAAAKKLQAASRDLRDLLTSALRLADRPPQTDSTTLPGPTAGSHPRALYAASAICHHLKSGPHRLDSNYLPTLEQILSGEAASLRLALALHLQYPPDTAEAARVLVRRALFDTSAEVRQAAIAGLHAIAPAKYLPLVLDGLRYPWAPVNFHAAEVLVTVRAEGVVPELLKLLDGPDPYEPFEMDKDGKRVTVRRELVRLNHHSNCLLCHAPSFDEKDFVRGPVPDPSRMLPPSLSAVYYGASGSRGLFVRADVTYLRQDFSEVQQVENPGNWPKLQRFDFLVRVRPLTDDEAAARRGREHFVGPPELPASRRATLLALQELTGLDGGLTAASWERALRAAPPPAKGPEAAP